MEVLAPVLDMPLRYTDMAASVNPGSNLGTKSRLNALRLQFMARQMASLVGARIKQRRLELGLKQRQLADLVDPTGAIDNQRISDWERGVHTPSDRYMSALSVALERPVSWFYEQEKGPTPDLSDNGGQSQLDRIEAELAKMRDDITKLSTGLAALSADSLRRTREQQEQAGKDRPEERPGEAG